MQQITNFKIGVFLSTSSMVLGILREFLIVGLLGFTVHNDNLQLYLSIFYTIGLSIDAMRLSCLNLYTKLSLNRILLSASLIGLPFSISVSFMMSYATGGLNLGLLAITTFGSFLNLIAALLITYKQRNNYYLSAQIINVMPNFILLPGILLCYLFNSHHIIFTIVCLTSLIPILQCACLFCIPNSQTASTEKNSIAFLTSLLIIARHFLAMLGEQFFQIIIRSAFYRFGVGYLSVVAISIRIYAAARFILIDSFIGSKLAHWEESSDRYLSKFINGTLLGIIIAGITLGISLQASNQFLLTTLQIILIMLLGFYFATLVRIIYFKINRYEINTMLVIQFASFELLFAFLTFLLTLQVNYPILALLWLGYIAKPFAQILLLRKSFHGLVATTME